MEGGPTAEKQPQQRFLNLQLILQLYMGVQHFSGGGGGPTFPGGGGGGPDAYFHKTHITCDFLEGVLIPCPPSGSARV